MNISEDQQQDQQQQDIPEQVDELPVVDMRRKKGSSRRQQQQQQQQQLEDELQQQQQQDADMRRMKKEKRSARKQQQQQQQQQTQPQQQQQVNNQQRDNNVDDSAMDSLVANTMQLSITVNNNHHKGSKEASPPIPVFKSMYNAIKGSVFSDFGTYDRFLIDGDAMIVHLFSVHFSTAGDMLLDPDRAQSLQFFFYFEWYLDNMLNRNGHFHIIFMKKSYLFYKSPVLLLLRNQCIEYYTNLLDTNRKTNAKFGRIQLYQFDGEWWQPDGFQTIAQYYKDNLFSFMLTMFPTKTTATLYDDNASFLFMLRSNEEYFDFFVEFSGLVFDSINMRSFIYTKRNIHRFRSERNVNYVINYAKKAELKLTKDSSLSPDIDTDVIAGSVATNRRNTLFVLALISYVSDDSRSGASPHQDRMQFAKVYCMYLALMEHVPVDQRSIHFPALMKDEDSSKYLVPIAINIESLVEHANRHLRDNVVTSEIVRHKVELDLLDHKLFLVVLTLMASRANDPTQTLDTLFGKELTNQALAIWHCLDPSTRDEFVVLPKVTVLLPSEIAVAILEEIKTATNENDKHSIDMYRVENDFIRGIIPDLPRLGAIFSADKCEQRPQVTQFIDNYHWHNGKPIDPDSFSLQMKLSAAKEKQWLKRAGFQRYADSLNDPKLKIVIKANADNSTSTSFTSVPKNMNDVHINPKTLERSRWASDTIKLLDNVEVLEIVKGHYIEHLALLRRQLDQEVKAASGATEKKKKSGGLIGLFKDLISGTLSSSSTKSAAKIEAAMLDLRKQIFQLVQKYLRYYMERAVLTMDDNMIGEHLYQIAIAPPLSMDDLANQVSITFNLGHKLLEHVSTSDSIEFQMKYANDTLIRNIDSRKDERVRDFDPDTWQVELLNIVDKNESALICAPTSSGKTFISFYAMEKVLKQSNDGVVVFVAPTKALVNQMYGELLNKYDKRYPAGSNKVVSGIFTRDWRKDVDNCQILITVPQCLEILLLSITNTVFVHRIRYIIFDEVHMVSNTENGYTWERLLLLNPAPFLALSATIGNLDAFHKWMERIEPTRRVHLIQYHHRFNDLKMFVYSKTDGALPLNPLSTIKARKSKTCATRALSAEVSFLSDESLDIYNALTRHFGADQTLSINPHTHFSNASKDSIYNLNKRQVHYYQESIKQFIADVQRSDDPVRHAKLDLVVREFNIKRTHYHYYDWEENIAEVLVDLKRRDLLPVIVFVFDRTRCENIVRRVADDIETFRNTDSSRIAKELTAVRNSIRAKMVPITDEDDPLIIKLRALEKEMADINGPFFGSVTEDDVDEYVKSSFFSKHLSPSLLQGIGVHHSGCNKMYLRAVEQLFRQKKIQVCFATGSLALGVNMPCRTVVFGGDSPYLNLMTFRQCSGRAGRRGLENRGNVMFMGVSKPKVHRLVNGKLSNLIGNTVISPSLTLSLLSRHNYSSMLPDKRSAKADTELLINAANKLIQRSFFQGESLQSQFQVHFSIDYLYREGFIDHEANARDFSGIVTHLSYLEPFNFVLTTLLKDGVFDRLPKDANDSDLAIVKILAHLFLTKASPPDTKSHSMTQFVNLPGDASQSIANHNNRAIPAFLGYISVYRDLHIKPPELPLSTMYSLNIHTNPSDSRASALLAKWRESTKDMHPVFMYKNGIQAMSGLPNLCSCYAELKYFLPSQSFFATSIIPVCDLSKVKINSYLVDFFQHGNAMDLITNNKLRQSDVFNLLQDFVLILKTIATALERRQPDHPITLAFQRASHKYLEKFESAYPNAELAKLSIRDGNTKQVVQWPQRAAAVGAVPRWVEKKNKQVKQIQAAAMDEVFDPANPMATNHLKPFTKNLQPHAFFKALLVAQEQNQVPAEHLVYHATRLYFRDNSLSHITATWIKNGPSMFECLLSMSDKSVHQVMKALCDIRDKETPPSALRSCVIHMVGLDVSADHIKSLKEWVKSHPEYREQRIEVNIMVQKKQERYQTILRTVRSAAEAGDYEMTKSLRSFRDSPNEFVRAVIYMLTQTNNIFSLDNIVRIATKAYCQFDTYDNKVMFKLFRDWKVYDKLFSINERAGILFLETITEIANNAKSFNMIVFMGHLMQLTSFPAGNVEVRQWLILHKFSQGKLKKLRQSRDGSKAIQVVDYQPGIFDDDEQEEDEDQDDQSIEAPAPAQVSVTSPLLTPSNLSQALSAPVPKASPALAESIQDTVPAPAPIPQSTPVLAPVPAEFQVQVQPLLQPFLAPASPVQAPSASILATMIKVSTKLTFNADILQRAQSIFGHVKGKKQRKRVTNGYKAGFKNRNTSPEVYCRAAIVAFVLSYPDENVHEQFFQSTKKTEKFAKNMEAVDNRHSIGWMVDELSSIFPNHLEEILKLFGHVIYNHKHRPSINKWLTTLPLPDQQRLSIFVKQGFFTDSDFDNTRTWFPKMKYLLPHPPSARKTNK
ncbi:hypothetical protein SAMD00019534_059020 [Acytostelium subglobosum LB1]|uniref:hypothetical protein n=1 Tax=Acytostelium subglobosum LB1 TaxID=1410327 RepID=UPI000644E613|nr:hypothetical protein SAMD00019534_059020 [Acytostelium subglobosum LB1]GAM22727.1 hypothetical protein SAMD00019534_059020 [Acytostelium subglobosum LB1]|eukprot:XP_012753954.1 hypothetical protein SAMD00019534_059020 [Acytostelium subglobosum LB1]